MKKKLKNILLMGLALSVLTSFTGCGEKETVEKDVLDTPSASQTRIITDAVGREVEIPVDVETIICLGSGAPRLAAYLQAMDMVVGSEAYLSEGVNIRRDYNPIYREDLLKLPVVGEGGGSGQNNGFSEEIILVSPDVIIAGFDYEAAEELEAQTGIPVVSVRHSTGLSPESFYKAMRVFGEVIKKEDRAEEVLSYMDSMLSDLTARTENVPEEKKLRAYAGAVTFNGRRGFSGTYSKFGIFDAIHAKNVAEDAAIEGFYEADLEKIMTWDPQVIFLDPGNLDLVTKEYQDHPEYFENLRAVQEGQVYTMPSFNNAGTNFTYAFLNAYHAGKILYPEEFEDVNLEEKAEEIFIKFLGVNLYEEMVAGGLYYGTIQLGE